MNKNNVIVGVVLLVLVAFGVGYFINRGDDGGNTYGSANSSTSTPSSGGKSLDLSGQQLTTIPESVLAQADVTSLNLSNNQLTTLPAGISRMTNLEVLNVENNRLVTLPAEIGQLKNLKTADFSNNRLTSLPAELGNLTQLASLKLGDYKGPASDIDALTAKLSGTEISK